MNTPLFLKRVLLMDAASCLAMGALLLIAAGALSGLFGIDRSILLLAGAILIPSGLFMTWTALRAPIAPALVSIIILGNILWVGESFLLLGQISGVTAIGQAFIVVQALGVAGITALETLGIFRLRAKQA
ncbi:MAG TPA: hypothetical protein VGD23_04915 [Sphingomicrobium sp.]